MNEQTQRRILPHPSPVQRHNQRIVLFVTVCVSDSTFNPATEAMSGLLLQAWSLADQWKVGRYMIMPDHVHFFCVPGILQPVGIKMWNKYWKGRFRRLAGLNRTVWQRDGWDTQMRDYDHYVEKMYYVRENPVRKGIVGRTQDWPYQGEVSVIEW